jgi:hypothetical protein
MAACDLKKYNKPWNSPIPNAYTNCRNLKEHKFANTKVELKKLWVWNYKKLSWKFNNHVWPWQLFMIELHRCMAILPKCKTFVQTCTQLNPSDH